MYFIHRTLQEYLAAVYISNTIREGITDYFEEFLNLPYFGFLPYFIAGLTKLRFMTSQMLLKVKQRISKYLLMFESEFPHVLTKKTMSNLTEFTDIAIVNDVMSTLKGVEFSTSRDIRSASTRSGLDVDSGLGHFSVGASSASTMSNLTVDSHSIDGIRSASTRSDLSMDSGLGHSNVGSRSASTRSDLSVNLELGHSSVASRSASTRSNLTLDSGLGHSSVGSRLATTRSDLSVDSRPGITQSALYYDYFLNYSHYVTGRLLPLSDHCWKLASMNEFMRKGFVEAIESVCNYKGVEFPSQNFKLTIDSSKYRLSYLLW